MPRIIAIDFGLKRTGLAWTDNNKIIASPIGTVETPALESELKKLFAEAEIERIVLGYPTRLDGSDTHSTQAVRTFRQNLLQWFPDTPVELLDERFTSAIAMQTMIEAGVKKKKRQEKQLINQISAVIILQDYLARG